MLVKSRYFLGLSRTFQEPNSNSQRPLRDRFSSTENMKCPQTHFSKTKGGVRQDHIFRQFHKKSFFAFLTKGCKNVSLLSKYILFP